MAEIGSISFGIDVVLTDLNKSLKSAEKSVQGAAKSFADNMEEAGKESSRRFKEAFEGIQTVGRTLMGIGVGIGSGLVFATKKAADFEEQVSNIKAISGATADEVKNLEKLAIDMGAKTKYSALEAAQAEEELLKAGLSVSQVMKGGLKGALTLATAGGLDLAKAAEIASTALNSFKKDGLSMAKAADILAGAANASATDVGELQMGLSQVASVASGVGMTFNDTATALALFANNGLKGSDAGTSLKTMLMNLQPQTKAQYEAFKSLGLINKDLSSKFFDTEGHLKSLKDISALLEDSMKGLTDAQRLQYMQTIFGSDAVRAANVLFKEGAKGVASMKTEMGKVTAEEVAKEKMNNLKGAIEGLRGSLETASITIGQTFIPQIKILTKEIEKAIEKFNSLPTATKEAIAKTVEAFAGLAFAGGVILLISRAIGFLVTTLGKIGTAFSAFLDFIELASTALVGLSLMDLLINPVTLAVAAVGLLIGAGYLLVKNWDKIKAKITELETTFENWFSYNLKKGIVQLRQLGSMISNALFNILANVVKFIGQMLVKGIEIGNNLIKGLVNGIKSGAGALYNSVASMMNHVRDIFIKKAETHSPSKFTERIGLWLMEGLAKGMKQNETIATSAALDAMIVAREKLTAELEKTNAKLAKIEAAEAEAKRDQKRKELKENIKNADALVAETEKRIAAKKKEIAAEKAKKKDITNSTIELSRQQRLLTQREQGAVNARSALKAFEQKQDKESFEDEKAQKEARKAKLNDNIEAEVSALKKIRQLTETESQLRLDAIADEEEAMRIAGVSEETITRYHAAAINQINKEVADKAKEESDRIKASWADSLAGIIEGTKSSTDLLKDLWHEAALSIARSIMGVKQQGQSLSGDMFNNFFDNLFGNSDSKEKIPHRAIGGPVSKRTTYLVGERGPELFTPGTNGKITPNNKLGGSSQQINVTLAPTFQSLDPVQGQEIFNQQLPAIVNAAVNKVKQSFSTDSSMRAAVRSAL